MKYSLYVLGQGHSATDGYQGTHSVVAVLQLWHSLESSGEILIQEKRLGQRIDISNKFTDDDAIDWEPHFEI